MFRKDTDYKRHKKIYVVYNIQKVVFRRQNSIQKVVYNIQKVVFRTFIYFVID